MHQFICIFKTFSKTAPAHSNTLTKPPARAVNHMYKRSCKGFYRTLYKIGIWAVKRMYHVDGSSRTSKDIADR